MNCDYLLVSVIVSNFATKVYPQPLQVTFQDKAISMKQSTKRIGLIILIVVLTIIECLLCLGIALDGKYQVEFSEDLAAIETFYRDVTILEVFMFINPGVAIVALCLLWRKNNDQDKSPDSEPNFKIETIKTNVSNLTWHGIGHVIYGGKTQNKVLDFDNKVREIMNLPKRPYDQTHNKMITTNISGNVWGY